MKTYYYESYLMHYGVKGMKWGVRRYHMSKRKVKKAMRNNSSNQEKVKREYRNEIKSNKKWNDLGKQSNSIAKAIMKSEKSDFQKQLLDPSAKTLSLRKKHKAISDQMTKIEIEVGSKYVDKLNDARLKDINYSGSVEKGRKMLKRYRLDYNMRYDGFIKEAYVDNDYIRPWNMD